MKDEDFFGRFGNHPSKLSSTALVAPNETAPLPGKFVKLLNVNTDDGKPIMVNINLRAEYSLSGPLVSPDGHTVATPAQGNPQVGSPLVARIRWGVGGSYQVLDFDLPPPRQSATLTLPYQQQLSTVGELGDGVSICLSGSSFEVQVRCDGNAQSVVAATNGTLTGILGNPTSPAKVLAFITPGTGANVGPIRRDVVIANSFGPSLAVGQSVIIPVPSFARKIWFPRVPSDTTTLSYASRDGQLSLQRNFNVPVGMEGPFEAYGWEQLATITNTSAVAVQNLAVSFDVNPN